MLSGFRIFKCRFGRRRCARSPDDRQIRVSARQNLASIRAGKPAPDCSTVTGNGRFVGPSSGRWFRDESRKLPQILQFWSALAHDAVSQPALLDAVVSKVRQRLRCNLLVQCLNPAGRRTAVRPLEDGARHIAPAHEFLAIALSERTRRRVRSACPGTRAAPA